MHLLQPTMSMTTSATNNSTQRQSRPDYPRASTFPSITLTRHRQRDNFVERLLKDPILQTMADIGKQENDIFTPLPVSQQQYSRSSWNSLQSKI